MTVQHKSKSITATSSVGCLPSGASAIGTVLGAKVQLLDRVAMRDEEGFDWSHLSPELGAAC